MTTHEPSSHPEDHLATHPHQPEHPHQPGHRPDTGPGRRRGGFVAGAALLAGLVGGVAGAAGWSALYDDQAASTTAEVSSDDTLTAQNVSAAGVKGVQQVAAAVLPSVVQINVRTSQGVGSGSGVILSSDGQILTNNHVVEDAVGDLAVSFNDGTSAPAEVVGTDPLTDLAVIQADGITDVDPAALGSSGDAAVGQEVVAVGSPFGLDGTVTSGIVSALDRPVDAGGGSVFPAIQTDAAINPGNSGGALVDLAGNVVGINTAIRTGSSTASEGGSIGLGFAIGIDEARPIVEQLVAGETPTHARIGVGVTDAVADSGVVAGALVEEVNAGSAGAQAGLEGDDVITAVDGVPVSGADSLVATIRQYRPGDEVTLALLRDQEPEETTLTLDSDAGTPAS
ncbi:MAG: trypsin-like peptidase domain-containing protein [Nocardioidaceae bacterium]|nr:trypsin-like peptidase domain-containing protein [Nocardioidaceae bacterium]